MSEGALILVIDDEVQIRRLLRLTLETQGFRVREAEDGGKGLKEIPLIYPDLVILDLNLPDMDGIEVLKSLRQWSRVPVIVLSVRSSDDDKIALLDAGADDYITKPFSSGELLARIRVALRHSGNEGSEGIFAKDDLSVDFVKRLVSKKGVEVKLTPTEYSLLKILISSAGRVITHNQIIKELWGENTVVDSSYLRVYVLQLRRKLEDDPAKPAYILTEPGVGYKFSE